MRTSEKEVSPSVGIELLRRHGTGVLNRTVREHEDGPTPPPRSARPPRSGIVSGGPGPVHAPFGPFRPARERSGARKGPAAQEGGIRAAGPEGILLPGREGRRSSAASAKRTSQTPVEANFAEYPFRNCLEIRNESRSGDCRAARRGRRVVYLPLLAPTTHPREAFQLFSKQFLHTLG